MRHKKPIIAVAAIRYYDIRQAHNLIKIKKYIGLAKKAGADIICFPESCVKKSGCLPINHQFIKEIQKECLKHSIWCVINEDIEVKRKTFNTSIVIDRKGKIKGTYRKINPYKESVHPGNRVKVIKTDFAKIGLAICWDLSFPGMFEKMKKLGAEIVFCPAQWWYDLPSHPEKHVQREIDLLRSMLLSRAFENILFVALANPLMESKYQVSYSAIACPHRILKELVNKEGLITAEIDLKEIKKFRKYYKKE